MYLSTSFSQFHDFLALCKPKVVALILLTAVVGMFLATPNLPPWTTVVFSSLGIGLAAASAAAFNHIIDQKIDSEMGRTRWRPLPNKRLSNQQALIFAISLGVLGIGILAWGVNVLTATLTFLALIGYAVLYTLYLKRATPQNIVIGGVAGAAPPLLGWVAITNSIDSGALLLFLIIFIWTPPHFWPLALHRRKEYAKVNVPMLPVTHGRAFTRQQILLYTVLLLVVATLPYLTNMSGLFYLVGSLLLGLRFLYYAIQLMRHPDDRFLPMRMFKYSITYLLLLFVLLLVDHYLFLPSVTT